MKSVYLALTLGTLLGAHSAMAYEEPLYDILVQQDDYEIRTYEPYLVAETKINGGFVQSGNAAFSILAGYIFGNNAGTEKMEMTAPVTSQAAGQSGTKMAMTVPVTSTPANFTQDGPQEYTYQFVMERKYDLETLPKPNDSRITLREVPARTVAVRQYSGRRTEQNYRANLDELLNALERDEIDVTGTPQTAAYDGPFTLPFLRRNEVLIEVAVGAD